MGSGLTADGERLARVETRQEDHRRQLDLTVPLVGRVEVLDERIDGIRDDLNQGLEGIRRELADVKRDNDSRSKERRQMLLALMIAGVGLLGTFGAQLIQIRGGK